MREFEISIKSAPHGVVVTVQGGHADHRCRVWHPCKLHQREVRHPARVVGDGGHEGCGNGERSLIRQRLYRQGRD